MPRDPKRLFGDQIAKECVDITILVFRANVADEKAPHLTDLLERVQVAELLLRMCIAAQINPKYVADIGKATRLVTGANGLPNIRYNGEGPALVDIGEPNFVAVIMPYRETTEKAYAPPMWAIEAAESLV